MTIGFRGQLPPVLRTVAVAVFFCAKVSTNNKGDQDMWQFILALLILIVLAILAVITHFK